MATLGKMTDCRYCSQVSKASGEDPIGSAPQADYWLLVEIKQPWPMSMFTENPIIAQVIAIVRKLNLQRGILIRPVAIAPDPDYSSPGLVRMIYYSRPAKQFAQYHKQEYVVPEDQASQFVIELLNRLLGKQTNLSEFSAYRQDSQHLREILVCTHTQVDLACGRFGTPIYRQLRQTYGQQGQPLRVWQSTHFGGHRFAPTLVDLPTGLFWGHLEPNILPQLIEHSGDHRQMQHFYRGWAGCTQFEQIAEREAWMREGWDWFTYPRAAAEQRKGLRGLKRFLYPVLRRIPIKVLQLWLNFWTLDARCVDVQIEYMSAHANGLYQMTVKETDEVLSALTSPTTKGQEIKIVPTKQYCVSHLVKSI
ncbi:MAG: sucrase ferredoxin [Cyanobacteria bacterium P01_C01_bin.118]